MPDDNQAQSFDKIRAGVPSMHPKFFMLSFRIFDAQGKPLSMRNQSFFTSEEAFEHAYENGLHGFVLQVDRTVDPEAWVLVDYTDPSIILTDDEKEHLKLLVRVPGEEMD